MQFCESGSFHLESDIQPRCRTHQQFLLAVAHCTHILSAQSFPSCLPFVVLGIKLHQHSCRVCMCMFASTRVSTCTWPYSRLCGRSRSNFMKGWQPVLQSNCPNLHAPGNAWEFSCFTFSQALGVLSFKLFFSLAYQKQISVLISHCGLNLCFLHDK